MRFIVSQPPVVLQAAHYTFADRFEVSHPSHKERGMDGAPGFQPSVVNLQRIVGDRCAATDRMATQANETRLYAPKIVTRTRNYLLNSEHPDASHVVVPEIIQERFDIRPFRFGVR